MKTPDSQLAAAQDFRAELLKIMPGYKWTVHKQPKHYLAIPQHTWPLEATGTQSSGSNRLSTLRVIRREQGGDVTYEVKSSGYGLRAPWLHSCKEGTLARALRRLQNHYEAVASEHGSHARSLQEGRKMPDTGVAS